MDMFFPCRRNSLHFLAYILCPTVQEFVVSISVLIIDLDFYDLSLFHSGGFFEVSLSLAV